MPDLSCTSFSRDRSSRATSVNTHDWLQNSFYHRIYAYFHCLPGLLQARLLQFPLHQPLIRSIAHNYMSETYWKVTRLSCHEGTRTSRFWSFPSLRYSPAPTLYCRWRRAGQFFSAAARRGRRRALLATPMATTVIDILAFHTKRTLS